MKLITEDYLRTIYKKNKPLEVTIYDETIITPSAREFLKEKNILLRRIKSLSSTPTSKEEKFYIPIEASGRHVHLSEEDINLLFGKDYQMTIRRELSQPGQFQYQERVDIIGKKNIIKNVSILGPARNKTQVEVSKTDAVFLGIEAPVRLSGDLDEAAPIFIASHKNVIKIEHGLIIAKAHIHMAPDDAKRMGLKDKSLVNIRVEGERTIIFENILVRINKNYSLGMHIDYDEANACGFRIGIKGQLLP